MTVAEAEREEGVVDTPDEETRRTTYLELFFDLVFVFAITQVASLVLGDTSAAGFARSLLVLGMVWWAWSAYAWTTTAIDLGSRAGRVGLLAAAGAVFFAAIALPDAFGSQGAWFASAYAAVRALQVLLSLHGNRHDPVLLRSSAAITPFFLIAPALVLAGGLSGEGAPRVTLWILAMAVDIAGALNAGRYRFRVSPAHFAERHALIMIIALGESIVAIGVAALGAERDLELATAVLVGFAGTAALWWGYFDFISVAAERVLARTGPDERGRLARDMFTFAHFPIVAGIVLFAVAAKKGIAHGDEPLTPAGRFALGAGVGLFMLGFVLARYRTVRRLALERIGAAAAVGTLAAASSSLDAVLVIALAVAILAGAYTVEAVRLRELRAQLRA